MSTTPTRPVWWSGSHTRALSCLTRDWQSLPALLAQGPGALAFAELALAGYAEVRSEEFNPANPAPSAHLFYRKASGL